MIGPVLNERSLEPAATPTGARFAALAGVLVALDRLGFPKVLRHVREATQHEVEPSLSVHAWLFQRAPRELRQFLAGRLSRAPFVEDLERAREDAADELHQASHDGAPAPGAGIAYLHDVPVIAIPGVARWEVDPLDIVLTTLGPDGTLSEVPAEVVQLCRAEQVPRREKRLRVRVLRAVAGGDDLWRRRQELFPRLELCAAVEHQVRALTGNEPHFQHVLGALGRLDGALGEWTAGPLRPGMDSSSESNQTLTHGTFGPMRDFACPDGETRRFRNHLKLFSCNWRIYYWETRSEDRGGRAFVGYVGVHLPTVLYRT